MSVFHKAPHIFTGHLELKVTDIERSLEFYKNMIGFKVLERTEYSAVLTANGESALLTIEQPKDIIPKQHRTTGLYHFAILLPSRSDLGSVIKHLSVNRYPIQGGSNHKVSEALYLADPDENGIELYADTPKSTWKWQGDMIEMGNDILDVEGLIAQAQGNEWNGLPSETVMGHIHMHVSELEKTAKFYQQGLGFELTFRFPNQALFFSTGGYHHHIAVNTWNGKGAPEPAKNSVGIKYFELVFPDEDTRKKAVNQLEEMDYYTKEKNGVTVTRDPSGNEIHLVV